MEEKTIYHVDMNMNTRRRRTIILGGAVLIAGFPITAVLSDTHNADQRVLKSDPLAKALNYHQDATTAPRSNRNGVAAADQYCHNCRFIEEESGKWRHCQLFPGKVVNEMGWCSSWASKSS